MKVLVLVLQALKSVLEPIPGWDNVQEQSHTHSPVPCKQQEYKQQQQHADKHDIVLYAAQCTTTTAPVLFRTCP